MHLCSSRRLRRLRLLTAASAAWSLAAFTAPAFAATTAQWLTPMGGNWTDPAKWSTNPNYPNNGSPTGATYHAVVGATGGAYTVVLNSSVALDALTIQSADATIAHADGLLNLV